jgi:hypothetical protein
VSAKAISIAWLGALHALAEAIRELGTVPSGHLYARVMQHVDLAIYEKLIATLVHAGLVTRAGDLLKWKGVAS